MNDTLAEQLLTAFLIKWNLYPTVKWTKPNVNFTPPADGIWVRMQVENSYSRIESVSKNPLILSAGLVTFQCFVKENTGTAQIKKFTDALGKYMSLYRDTNNLFTDTPATRHVGVNNGWYQVNLNINYELYNQDV